MDVSNEGSSRDRRCSHIIRLALFIKALNLAESLSEVTLHSIERILLLVRHTVTTYMWLMLAALVLKLFSPTVLLKHVNPILHQDQLCIDFVKLSLNVLLIGVKSVTKRAHSFIQ